MQNQSDSETIDQYVTELKRLAKDCAYGELAKEKVKEKLVQADAFDLAKSFNHRPGD